MEVCYSNPLGKEHLQSAGGWQLADSLPVECLQDVTEYLGQSRALWQPLDLNGGAWKGDPTGLHYCQS